MAFGDTIDAEVLPGNHEIVGKNELGKATHLSLNVPEQDDVKVRVGAVPKGCFAILMWVFPPAPTIILEVIAE